MQVTGNPQNDYQPRAYSSNQLIADCFSTFPWGLHTKIVVDHSSLNLHHNFVWTMLDNKKIRAKIIRNVILKLQLLFKTASERLFFTNSDIWLPFHSLYVNTSQQFVAAPPGLQICCDGSFCLSNPVIYLLFCNSKWNPPSNQVTSVHCFSLYPHIIQTSKDCLTSQCLIFLFRIPL